GHIPDDWFAAQIALADRIDGDIDTLSARIAQIRTWTFAANRPDWLKDPEHWQGIARGIEDKLSDALHERLTERFVDRRTSVLMRRLRENTMLNTEIGKTGEVTVEGHVIGRLDGFMFAPESAEAGSDAKALQATALKALAGEIDARAEKLSNAPDDQFVLANDGTLRWTGDAVAKLVAADNALSPRIRIVADDRLTGAPRDAVQARLDLWLKTHIEKLLAPLFELQKAEDVTGIARGIAFQLVEALGVIERAKIATEMKDLDQPSRAVLRKYGVRFGAYHIFVPSLLKPGARGLASLLWALKQDDVDFGALTGAQHLAGSGRTSFAADKALTPDAYRVLGYKLCGERAVRVDILERLADLIRPALSWRPGSSLEKPAGAFDGRAFVVTQAMTSLTGSAGEDFASVLRALGYRMERRPPMPEAPPVAAPVEVVAGETVATQETASPESVASDTAIAAEGAATDESPSATKLPEVEFAPRVEEPLAVETPPAAPPAAEASAEPAAETPVADAPAGEAPAILEVASSEEAASSETAPAEPVLVEVWRPAGRSDDRRPRQNHGHDRNRHRNQTAAGEGAKEGEAADGAPRERHHRRRPHHRRPDAPANAEAAPSTDGAQASPPREDRHERRPHEGQNRTQKFEGKFGGKFQGKSFDGKSSEGRPSEGRHGGKFEGKHQGKRGDGPKGGRDGRRERDGGGAALRTFATSASPRDRDRPADPNSPFAKLAALKDQLARKD
ncbi:MAG TPA: helicase, partial [Afipia sp.]